MKVFFYFSYVKIKILESLACLNCDTIIEGKFCSNCGQRTDTHRITAKHLFMHDLLHGVWHIEKGILFTMKQALIRPGCAALEYISGKRIKYYNVFYLILIVVGLTVLAGSVHDQYSIKYLGTTIQPNNAMDQFTSDYAKFLIYSLVPFFALNSFILFKRKKFNFSEHLIIAGMLFLGVMIILLISIALAFTEFLKYVDFISKFSTVITPVVIMIYVLLNLFKTFKNDYKIVPLLVKVILFLFLLILEILSILLFLLVFFSI